MQYTHILHDVAGLYNYTLCLSIHPADLDGSHESWAIRHCALLGLSRVNQVCKDLPAKDGFSSVAWSRLTERQSVETDRRVLEACKLQQVSEEERKVRRT